MQVILIAVLWLVMMGHLCPIGAAEVNQDSKKGVWNKLPMLVLQAVDEVNKVGVKLDAGNVVAISNAKRFIEGRRDFQGVLPSSLPRVFTLNQRFPFFIRTDTDDWWKATIAFHNGNFDLVYVCAAMLAHEVCHADGVSEEAPCYEKQLFVLQQFKDARKFLSKNAAEIAIKEVEGLLQKAIDNGATAVILKRQ